jgi:tRNA nucleotidyltransferase (CCA-adding enzyme)
MKVFDHELSIITPSRQELESIKQNVSRFTDVLESELKKSRLDADIFVGGSFAKGTLIKSSRYDIDIFIRFSWKYSDLGKLLETPLKQAAKRLGMRFERIHGSRDYFRVFLSNEVLFEIIPVTRIAKPKEERNVTDLSYFHVSYVKKAARGLEDQIRLAKSFCKAQEVYGAESYINGFSGYGLECLIIYYKRFDKMLKELAKAKERIVIDMKKYYRTKQELLLSMNEAKIKGPIILVDPTHKERNVLAALNHESFAHFQKAAEAFLKKPSQTFFSKKEISMKELAQKAKSQKAQTLEITLATNRQEGDIAGTKMKKFSLYLRKELTKLAEILEFHFDYNDGKESVIYLVARPKKEIIRMGPPVNMIDYVKDFKKSHKDTFVKNGIVHARIKLNLVGNDEKG